MLKIIKPYLFLTLIVLFNPIIFAAEFKQPGEFTDEDYKLMFSGSDNYNQCLQKSAATFIDKMDDPRQIADMAMKECDTVLLNLTKELDKRNFDPGFSKGYIKKINMRSARTLLSNLMYQISNRQQQ